MFNNNKAANVAFASLGQTEAQKKKKETEEEEKKKKKQEKGKVTPATSQVKYVDI